MHRLKHLFQRRRIADDLSEEMRQHLEEKIETLVAQGMPREEAVHAARRAFGNATLLEQRSREVWMWPFVESLWADIKFALRQLRKSPGFAVTALLMLAFGIGATAAVFSLVDAVLIRPLQFTNEKRLVQIFESNPGLGLMKDTVAPANYLDSKTRNHVFAGMAAADGDIFTITGRGRPEQVDGTHVSPNLFPLLGVEPILGRNFTQDEDRPGSSVALIGAGLWRRRYGSDPHVLGKTIHLDGIPFRIIGVMPFGFTFHEQSEVWVPLALTSREKFERDNHFLLVYGLLRPGVNVKDAQREMNSLSRQLEHEYPTTNTGLGVIAVPLRDQLVGSMRLAIFVLAAGVGIVLLITCMNIAGLMIARGVSRQREMAVRLALGARRYALFQQGFIGSFLLTISGGLLGLLFAVTAMPLLRHFVPTVLAAWAQPTINWTVLAFTFLTCSAAALAFCFAGQISIGPRLQEALQQASRNTTSSRQRFRSILVVGEIALAAVVLVATGLLGETSWKLAHTNLGFQSSHILTMRTSLPISNQTPYRNFQARTSFYTRVLDGIEHLPGVRSAGYTTFLPLTNSGGTSTVLIEGAPRLQVGQFNNVTMRIVTPHYFKTLGIGVIRGRIFTDADAQSEIPVAVINQAMARKYWPHEDAVGRHFRLDEPGAPWMTVLGVVENVRGKEIETAATPETYLSYRQNLGIPGYPGYFTPRDLAVLVAGDPLSYADSVRKVVWSIDPQEPVSDVQSMQHLVDSRLESHTLESKLFAFFAGIALFLSALGIYGLTSYSVAQRTREIGLRIALGAQKSRIMTDYLLDAGRLIALGLLFGVIGSLTTVHLIGSYLYGVSDLDLSMSAAAIFILLATALIAAYIPARRAASIDPIRALRAE